MLEIFGPYTQPHLCPISSLVAHLRTSRGFRQSPASRIPDLWSSFAAPWTGLHGPEIHSTTWRSHFSELFYNQGNLAQYQHEEYLPSSPLFSELTFQAPEACSHSCCRNSLSTCQTLAIEKWDGSFQITWQPCTNCRRSTLYARHRNQCEWHSPDIRPSFWSKGSHLLHKQVTCSNHFLAHSYVRVRTENMLRLYFHQRWTHILKKSRSLLISNKQAVLKQPETCLCSCWSTSVGIRNQLSCLAELYRNAYHPIHLLLLQSQQHFVFLSVHQPTKESVFRKNTCRNSHRVCQPRVAHSNFLVASVVCMTEKLPRWRSPPTKLGGHLYHGRVHWTRRGHCLSIDLNCTNIV